MKKYVYFILNLKISARKKIIKSKMKLYCMKVLHVIAILMSYYELSNCNLNDCKSYKSQSGIVNIDCSTLIDLSSFDSNKFDENTTYNFKLDGKRSLTSIKDGVFNGLTFDNIYLTSNSIQQIGRLSFSNCKVSSLNLMNNKINKIEEYSFASIGPHLKQLYLGYNKLSEMDQAKFENIFSDLANLHTLVLASNNLTVLPNLSVLKSLKYFDVSKNQLKNLNTYSGIENSLPVSIEKLYFDENKLKNIEKEAFSKFIDLKELSLKANEIDNIKENLFLNNKQLQYLDLSENIIKSLPNSNFKQFVSMKNLILNLKNQKAYNGTILLYDYAFDSLKDLTIILGGGFKITNKAFCSNETNTFVKLNLVFDNFEPRNDDKTCVVYKLIQIESLKISFSFNDCICEHIFEEEIFKTRNNFTCLYSNSLNRRSSCPLYENVVTACNNSLYDCSDKRTNYFHNDFYFDLENLENSGKLKNVSVSLIYLIFVFFILSVF